MRVLPMGASAVLVEDPPGDPAAWSLNLRSLGLPGVTDIVPAVRTVLVQCGSPSALATAVERLAEIDVGRTTEVAEAPTITIPVRYDGVDLADVARVTGRSVDDVIALHSGA